MFLDATCCKASVNRRVVSQAVVIATGVTAHRKTDQKIEDEVAKPELMSAS